MTTRVDAALPISFNITERTTQCVTIIADKQKTYKYTTKKDLVADYKKRKRKRTFLVEFSDGWMQFRVTHFLKQ